MAYNPNNPNGQAAMANSAPVVIASNQTTIPVSGTGSVFTVAQPTAANLNATVVGTGTFAVQASQATAANLNATVVGTGTFAVQADTELPAAAALSDTTTNPTAPMVGSALMAFNGTTWERVRSDGTNNDADADQPTGVLSVEAHSQIHNGTNWDRVRSIDALSGTNANNTVVGIQAVGIGPGYSHRYGTNASPLSLATAANSASTIEVEGGNTMTWTLTNAPTGTFIFEASGDATNWFSVEVFDATQDLWVSGQNLTPVTGRTYHVACAGFRSIRMRTVTTLSVALTHTVNVSMGQELIAGIDTGAAPHNFGYTLVHRDATYTLQQTSAQLWIPTTGRRFAVTDLTISSGGTVAGVVTVYDSTAGSAYTTASQNALFRGEFAPSSTSRPGVVKNFNVPYVSTAANNVLLVTTSAVMNPLYIQVNGYEI
jgi:hypothetical protein